MGSLGYLTDRWQLTGLIRGGQQRARRARTVRQRPERHLRRRRHGLAQRQRDTRGRRLGGLALCTRVPGARVVHVREPRQHVPEHLHARHADRLEQPHVGGARASGCARGSASRGRPARSGPANARNRRSSPDCRTRRFRSNARSSALFGEGRFELGRLSIQGGARFEQVVRGALEGNTLGLQPAAGVCRGHGLRGQPPRGRELAGPRRRRLVGARARRVRHRHACARRLRNRVHRQSRA